MNAHVITDQDREMARMCVECAICSRARHKQRGIAFWLVKHFEGSLCPYCQAYERVYGRKAHEAVPPAWKLPTRVMSPPGAPYSPLT